MKKTLFLDFYFETELKIPIEYSVDLIYFQDFILQEWEAFFKCFFFHNYKFL